MKKIIGLMMLSLVSTASLASVVEGVVQQATVIETTTGSDGHPILGAAIGVGLGSLVGGGRGRDTAMVAGGLLGAKRQAAKHQTIHYGWRYIVKVKEDLQVVDAWCATGGTQCSGVAQGTAVYVINGNQVEAK